MKKTKASLFIGPLFVAPLLAAMLTATACTPADAQQHIDLNAARQSLIAADRAHAAATAGGLLVGFPTAFDDEVVLLWPTLAVTKGRSAAVALLQTLPGAAKRTMTWYPVRADVSADGASGYTYGYGQRATLDGAGVASTPLKYIAFWKRAAGGEWKVAAWALGGGAPGAPDGPSPGCETPTNATSPRFADASADAAREAVMHADAAFAALSATSGAAQAFITNVADDGALMGGGATFTCGRKAVQALYEGSTPAPLAWTPRIADAAATGDLGFTVGVATIGTGAQTTNSKYLTVWKRQRGGEWRFVADGGNPAPAPTP